MVYSEKFKNLVLFILSSEDYSDEGIKKLNKILYFIDFYFYREHEKFISGVDYAKAGRGPIINDYKLIFNQLCKDGVLEKKGGGWPIMYEPKMKADITKFSPEELDHVHKLLRRYGKLSSADLESISHDQQPWVLTENDGDIIDPELALLVSDDTGSDEVEVVNKELKDELIGLANAVVDK